MYQTLIYLLLFYAFFLAGCNSLKKDDVKSEITTQADTLVSIGNGATKITFSLLGGSLVRIDDESLKVNPFSWKETSRDTAVNGRNSAVLQGQFLSFGRWSFPTPGEAKLGMPVNGEPANNWWKLEPSKSNRELKMSCEAPLDGFTIKRQVVISESAALFKATETITNENSVGRTTTLVHNIIFVPPFFEASAIINSNASFGFNQAWGLSKPDKFEYQWPHAYMDTLKISSTDISTFSIRFRYLSSHIFSDSMAWFTVYNPSLRALLGYVWKSDDYPWIHFKNEINYGKPNLRSIAFGTAGLSDKFSVEEQMAASFHGRKNFEFVDAKSAVQKSWYCFYIVAPPGFQKVTDVSFADDHVILHILTNNSARKEVNLSL